MHITKDSPHIADPINHHKITCKKCNKTTVVSKRYTRLCDRCRVKENHMLQGAIEIRELTVRGKSQ